MKTTLDLPDDLVRRMKIRALSEKVWPFSKFRVLSSEFQVQPAAGAVRIGDCALKPWGRCAGQNLELGTWNSELGSKDNGHTICGTA